MLRKLFKLPIVLVLAFGLAVWFLHLAHIELPLGVPKRVWIAASMFAFGVVIILTSAVTFRRANTTLDPVNPDKASSLVSTGIFSFSRNPIYVGFLMFVLAFAVASGNLLSLIFVPAFWATANRLYIEPEEAALETLFGKDYLAYKHRVRRWL